MNNRLPHGVFVLLAMLSTALPGRAAILGNKEHLEAVISRHAENLKSIKTWRGRATIEKHELEDTEEPDGPLLRVLCEAEFVVDMPSDRFRYNIVRNRSRPILTSPRAQRERGGCVGT